MTCGTRSGKKVDVRPIDYVNYLAHIGDVASPHAQSAR
jgi:hypothetical protein